MKIKTLPAQIVSVLILCTLAIFGFNTAYAQILTWNNGSGNFQWDTTSQNWGGTTTWNNAVSDAAIFGATGIGTVNLTTAITASSITFDSAGYTIAGNTLTLEGVTPSITNNADTSISSALAGTAGLVVDGTGTLALTGANTYTGSTVVSDGILQIGDGATVNGTLSSGSYTIGSAGRLYLNYATAAGPNWANITGAGTLELNSAQPVNGSANWGGLNFPSSFTGTLQLDNGRINGTPGNFGGMTSCVISNGAQFLATSGGANAIYTQNFSINGQGWGEGGHNYGALRSSGENAIFSGNIYLAGEAGLYSQAGQSVTTTFVTVKGVISGTNNLDINAYAGPITLTGTNTYAGNTVINSGGLVSGTETLQIGDGTNDGSIASSASIINNGGDLIFDVVHSNSFPNAITDSGSGGTLEKTGVGTLVLGGVDSYTGATVVTNGTLEINGSLSGGGAVTVDANGVLDGTGTINDPVTIAGGATLAVGAPGSSTVGGLTIDNALTLYGGCTNFLRISKNGGAPANDVINGSGSLNFIGTLVVANVTSDGHALASGDTFNLFTGFSSYSGGFTAVSLPSLPAGLGWDISQLANNGVIKVNSGTSLPIFSPAGGSYVGPQTVTISSATPGATIYYTLNGSTPNSSSPSGTTPVTIVLPINTTATTTTVSAYAQAAGYAASTVVSETYTTETEAVWLNPNGGSWATIGNWTNGIPANGVNGTADLSQLTLPGAADVTLDGNWSIGNLIFGDKGNNYNWELDPGTGGVLTLGGTNSPTITVGNQTTTITAVIAGVNGLIKAGAGSLVFTGANTYTGETIVTNGILQIGNATVNGTLSSGSYTIGNAGRLYLNYSTAAGPNWADILGAGTLELNSAQGANGNANWGGLNLPSNFTGTLQVDIGRINATPALFGGTTSCIIGNGAQLLANDGSGNGVSYTYNQNFSINGDGWGEGGQNYGALRVSGEQATFTGNIVLAGAAGIYTQNGQSVASTTLTISGDISGTNDLYVDAFAGPITLTGTNSYTGNTWLNPLPGGSQAAFPVLQIGNGTNDGSISASASIIDDGTLIFDVIGSETYSNVINDFGGGGTLTKIGGGTLTLSGADTYTGITSVGGGTLEVDGSVSGSAVAVNAGGTLDGIGTIGGAVTINNGGTLAVNTGNNPSVGTLSISDGLTISTSSTNYLRISKTGGTTTNDVISGSGTLNYSGALVVANITSGGTQIALGDSFILFAGFSSYTGSFDDVVLPALPAGESWDLSQLDVNGSIRVSNGLSVPVFNPPAGGYVGSNGQPFSITINSPTPGATIYYTTNGSTPTGASPSGIAPVTVVLPANVSVTVQAYAHEAGYNDSGVASATYFTEPKAIWTSLSGGSWSSTGSWTNNIIPNANDVVADFSQLTLPAYTVVTLDGTWTVGSLIFGDKGNNYSWEIDNGSGGPLTLAGANMPTITVSNQTTTINANLAGTNGLIKAGNGTLAISSDNTYTGGTVVNAGVLLLSGVQDNNSKIGPGLLTVNTNGTVAVDENNQLGTGTIGVTPSILVEGGTFDASSNDVQFINLEMNGGTLTTAPATQRAWFSYGDVTIDANPAATSISGTWFMMRNTSHNTIFNVAAGGSGNDLTVSAALEADGYNGGYVGLTKAGAGTLTLSGANTYSGPTTVSDGVLLVNGSISAGSAVTVQTGATLGGAGSIGTVTTVQAGGTLQGGNASDAGTLAMAGLNLGSSSIDVTHSSFKVAEGGNVAATTLNVDGTNIVNILDSSLSVGTNTLFTYSGGSIGGSSGFDGFKLGSLPTLPSGSSAMLLNTGSAVQLAITSGTIVSNPVMTNTVSGSTLTLSWPSDDLGWRLEVQTNSLSTGLSTNWSTWPNSTNVNSVSIQINKTAGAVFFRLVSP